MRIDFFQSLPKTKRGRRVEKRSQLSNEEIELLKEYGEEYFDGELGYGGYYYDGRWKPVAEEMVKHYMIGKDTKILEIGCAKGYLLYEFYKLGYKNVFGCDISDYAISNTPEDIRNNCKVMRADSLEYFDNSFDLVYTIDCIHNLYPEAVDKAIKEIIRVSRNKKKMFIRVGSFRNKEELDNIKKWAVTSLTFEPPEYWLERFKKLNYKGDYYFRFMESID